MKLNLGMNRFGFLQNELDMVLNHLRSNKFTNICLIVHPNLSYINQEKTQKLISKVLEISVQYQVKCSVANSAVVMNSEIIQKTETMVRVGTAIYGYEIDNKI